MKLTRHNGRSGKNGVYSPKHNDRNFDLDHADHIDPARAQQDILWDCYQGFSTQEERNRQELSVCFEQVEKLYYFEHYDDYCEGQHKRNKKQGHSDRDRTTDDLRLNKKTCPEESLLQIGTIEEHVPPDVLFQVATEFFQEFERRFGSNVHILDWALHLDEATPHIHERHVFDGANEYGEIQPMQEKGLEALGIELPDPEKPRSKKNNRKMTFDAICRVMLFDICKEHGLHLDEEPSYGGRAYLEKQDYILMKQKEKMAEQDQQIKEKQLYLENAAKALSEKMDWIRDQDAVLSSNAAKIDDQNKKLEELTIRIEDTESFVNEIAEVAYERAVESVTVKVMEETHNMDFELIEEERRRILQEHANSPQIIQITSHVFNRLLKKFSGFTKAISEKLNMLFKDPQQKEKIVKEIRQPIRESVLAKLNREKARIAAQSREKALDRKPNRKHDMEL